MIDHKKTSMSVSAATKNNDAPSVFLDVPRATKQLLAAQDAESRQTAARALAAAVRIEKLPSRDAPRPLAEMLRGSDGEAEAAAYALRELATCTYDNREWIVKAGAIPPLVALLQKGTDLARENAVGILRALTHSGDKVSTMISKAGAIPGLVDLLQTGTDLAKEKAVDVLTTLLWHEGSSVSAVKPGRFRPSSPASGMAPTTR